MRFLSKMFVVVLLFLVPAWTSPAQENKVDQKSSAAAAAKYGAGQAVDDSAGIFTFGAPAAISAGQTRFLASLGGGVTTARLAAIVPKNGTLKNFYWTCESSTLNGNGNNITIIVKGIDPPRQVVLTWDLTTQTGSNTASLIPVKAGETLSVRVGLTGTMGAITRLSVSFELTAPSESPWKVLDPDIYFDTGNVGIGTDTPGEKLTVDGVVEATEGFKFPDGSVQLEAAKPTGTMHSLEPAALCLNWQKGILLRLLQHLMETGDVIMITIILQDINSNKKGTAFPPSLRAHAPRASGGKKPYHHL